MTWTVNFVKGGVVVFTDSLEDLDLLPNQGEEVTITISTGKLSDNVLRRVFDYTTGIVTIYLN